MRNPQSIAPDNMAVTSFCRCIFSVDILLANQEDSNSIAIIKYPLLSNRMISISINFAETPIPASIRNMAYSSPVMSPAGIDIAFLV